MAFQTEYGADAPLTVDAAVVDQTSIELYLILGNKGYHYQLSGTPPNSLLYAFLNTFDFTSNDASNPFAASLSSPLSVPPSYPHALFMNDDSALAFCEEDLYTYDRATQHWTLAGAYTCP